MAISRNMQAAL